MTRKFFAFLLVLASFALLYAPTAAQDNVIVDGLNSPRGMAYDADGNLYVAEAGVGGSVSVAGNDELGSGTVGGTSQVTMIAPDGTQSVAVAALPSLSTGPEGLGVVHMVITSESMWLVLNEGVPMLPFADSVIELDRATGRMTNFIDLYAYEQDNNPDGTDEIYSNPTDVALADDGTLYIVDTGANTLYTWTEADGLQVFKSWGDDPVPTSVDFAPDGTLYVGFLGQGIAPGAARIDHLDANGEVIEMFGNLTAVTDIVVTDDGALYAVQMLQFGEQGPAPESGSVVAVTADGATPVQEGLNFPYGLEETPDGDLVVSVNAAFVDPGTGAVMLIPLGEM
ncbi:MAG TPA: ScyD/ScyE family protein [Aggregatilinea sp.]|jgi:sugar lactone lactonase YvrE|uniref:ScyD/ScyE family protein n=1 Tax=Aggregatilinea sp. TaxID=2806333 RepID=UPI002C7A66DD|nr:ScyD/ScyE family protein [Aggregatilinea sp.]HML24061.1 ScyD/ScyE family protein [Aggregatilinea sp.]